MSDNKHNFQKLTPINDVSIGIYCDALDFVFENDDLKNIALSGAYSAGKSSVLESYKTQHSDKKFLHISLAHFEEVKTENNDNAKLKTQAEPKKETVVKESILEGKILNQLIHQIDTKRIPQTNFRVKHKVSTSRIVVSTIMAVVFALLLLHIVFFSTWVGFVNGLSTAWLKCLLQPFVTDASMFIGGLICAALAGMFIFYAIKLQTNKGIFKKFSANKMEIEIFEDCDDSYFDKYLNEVLYLFEQSKADVIVFEDMDRYNANRIFERLREVNTLINTQRRKEAYKPLRFFYLLRDDIFISKDRTKFFDFIVPIVPVVDGSNSYDQFIAHLKAGSVFELFDESFLQELSLYIDDMRILKNIYNEFIVYYSRLNTTELNPNKMLAIIAYKNLFPRDFSDLQLGKGFVCTLFKSFDSIIKNEIANLDTQIKTILEKIESAKKEHLESAEEVDRVYATQLTRLQQQASYNSSSRTHLSELQTTIARRKENIENRTVEKAKELKEKIAIFENEKKEIRSQKFAQILTRANINEIFEQLKYINIVGKEEKFDEIKSNAYFALLKFLVRNGHIDETYADYMTYFYDNSLSPIDKIFLRSVSDQVGKDHGYKLKEPQKVVERLRLSAFKQPEILNFDLLFFLLESQEYEEKLDALITQLRQTKNYAFVQGIFTAYDDDRLNLLVNKLNMAWNGFLIDIINGAEFVESCRERYILRTLYHTPNDSLKDTALGKSLSSYISHKPDFLHIDAPKIDKLITRFILLAVCFETIDYDVANKELFEAVYAHSLYKLSFNNIAQMLTKMYGFKETIDFKHKNYSLIMTIPESPLAQYVNENINEYLGVIQANSDRTVTDYEKFALVVLNNDDVSEKNKSWYISELTTKIEILTAINDNNLWKSIIEHDIAVHSEKNVIDYFVQCENTITDELVEFINSDDYEYDYSAIRNQYSEDVQRAFFNAILKCNDISNTHYTQIMRTLDWRKNIFNIENVDIDKILILIDLKVIKMNNDSLPFMRENYEDAIPHYIESNIKEYTDIVSGTALFDESEAISVLLLNVADKCKLKLLEGVESEITARNQQYSDTVRAYILERNLNPDDIAHFICSYQSEGTLTKAVIEKITLREIDNIFDNECSIDKVLVDKLLGTNITNAIKLKLFALILSNLNEEQCKQYLTQLRLDDYAKLFDQKRPTFEKTAINERLLSIFRDKNWITKFEEDEKDNTLFRAYGRKLHSDKADEEDMVLLD